MGIVELMGFAVGLSMDAFAVALCKGLGIKQKQNVAKSALVIGLFFGGFQAVMPLIGWALGSQFARYITPVDHWIAFGLLLLIGGKMLYEALREGGEEEDEGGGLRLRELLILSIATSIDALAIGITFAFLPVDILPSVSLIGVTTFALSGVGVLVGHTFGAKLMRKAEIAGGVILILIGVKILLEHLGVL